MTANIRKASTKLVVITDGDIMKLKRIHNYPGELIQLPASPWQTCPPGLQGFFACDWLLGGGC
jgi:hypothetical protein